MDSEQTSPAGGETPETGPPESAPRALSRKQFLTGAATAVGAGTVLGAAGAVTPPTPPPPPSITPPTPPTPPVITPPTPPTPPSVGGPVGSTGKPLLFVNGKIHTFDG